MLFAPTTLLADYKIQTMTGQVYHCKEKYTIDSDGLVNFRLKTGAEMAISKKLVDWDMTAIINGEKSGSKHKKRNESRNTKKKKRTPPDRTLKKTSEQQRFERDRAKREIVKEQPLWNRFADWGTGKNVGPYHFGALFLNVFEKWGLVPGLLAFLVAFLCNCVIFWLVLNVFGEDVTYAPCALWLFGVCLFIILASLPLNVGLNWLVATIGPATFDKFFIPVASTLAVLVYLFFAWFLGRVLDCKMYSVFGSLVACSILGKAMSWGMATLTTPTF